MELKITSVLECSHVNPAHRTHLLRARLGFTVNLKVRFLHLIYLFIDYTYVYNILTLKI